MTPEGPRRLILMRHAKSDWGASDLPDRDRPLNPRGRLAATLMGAFLKDAGLTPDLALVSSATRTRETWARMDLTVAAFYDDELYLAGPEAIFAACRTAPAAARTVLALIHQPGVQEATNRLIRGDRVEAFPTAQMALIALDIAGWDEVDAGAGRLERVVAPKTLV